MSLPVNRKLRNLRLARVAALAACAAAVSLPQSNRLCSVEGTLFDADNGHPLSGVEVKLRRISEPDKFQYANSDSHGTFHFPQLGFGNYMISVDRDFAPTFRRLPLPVGANLRGVDFKLQRLGSVGGYLVDPDGKPVVGAWVSLRYVIYKNAVEQLPQRGTTRTGAQGEFRIDRLSPGPYLLEFHPPALTSAPFLGKDGDERPPVRQPVSTYYPGVTDPDEAEQLMLRSGEQFESKFVLQTAPTVCVRSEVAGTGPQYGVVIGRVHHGGESALGAGRAMPGEEFEFCGIPAGEYRLTARNGTGTVAWQKITVLNRETRAPDLIPSTARPMEIRPRLSPAKDDAVLPAALQIRTETIDRSFETDESADAERDSAGRLVANVHFEEQYRLQVTGLAPGQYVASATVEGHDAYAVPFRPSNSALDLVIDTGGPTLTGQVRDENGQPVSGAAVMLAAWPLPKPLPPNRLLTAETNDEGVYRFTNMPAGSYRVIAYRSLPRYLSGNPAFARDSAGKATLVDLAPSEYKMAPLTVFETPRLTRIPR